MEGFSALHPADGQNILLELPRAGGKTAWMAATATAIKQRSNVNLRLYVVDPHADGKAYTDAVPDAVVSRDLTILESVERPCIVVLDEVAAEDRGEALLRFLEASKGCSAITVMLGTNCAKTLPRHFFDIYVGEGGRSAPGTFKFSFSFEGGPRQVSAADSRWPPLL